MRFAMLYKTLAQPGNDFKHFRFQLAAVEA